MSDNQTFESFGIKFQTSVLQAVMTDRKFFEKIFEILQEDYFTYEPHKAIWCEINKLYTRYNSVPTYDMLKTELSNYPDGELKESILTILVDIKSKSNRNELEYTKDKAFEMCKNGSMRNAIIASVELLKEGKYEEIQKTIENSLKITSETDLGHDYFTGLSNRSIIQKRDPIPTGWNALDSSEVLDGGLAPGELGMVMAPTGGGKSFFLVNIGYGALAAGKNVVHYSFELSEKNIGHRYDARITGIPVKELYSRVDEWEERLTKFTSNNMGKLVIKEYPTKSATVNTLKFHIGRLRADGFEPDLVIVDYLDLMKSRRGYEQKRFELEAITEDIRSFCMESQLPIWTATQTNREGFNDDIITMDKIGEAISKAQVVDFFGTFSQKYFHIGKNRMGSANTNFTINIDYGKSKITIGDLLAEEKDNPLSTIQDSLSASSNVDDKFSKLYRKFRDDR